MRKTLMAALIGGAFAFGGQAHASLTLDLNGTAAGGVIVADALDWAPTSFLAQGGNRAIRNFQNGACDNGGCNFEVLTHAKLTAYAPAGGASFIGLPNFGGEITMIARYTETVVASGNAGSAANPRPFASFESTGAGWLEFYFSPTGGSPLAANDLTGSGFNAGTLIGRLEGVTMGAFGSFAVTGGPVLIDGSGDGNQYGDQRTVTGTGSQEALRAGTTSVVLDSNFFKTGLDGFSIQYENISIGLPFTSVNPSDCFNATARTNADVGTTGLASTCNTTHINGRYNQQNPGDPGYLPQVGIVNGLGLASDDFVAQTDYNSSVTGSTVPEPGSLALVGLALASLGFAATRRRRG